MSHRGRKSNTESIMNTSNDSLAEHLEKLARDMEYPPLNGGPTQEEIISALKASAEIIGEYEHDEDLMEDLEDFAAAAQEETEKIKSIIAEAIDDFQECLEYEKYMAEYECMGENQLNRLTAIQDKLKKL